MYQHITYIVTTNFDGTQGVATLYVSIQPGQVICSRKV